MAQSAEGKRSLVGSIDQGTASSRFLVFDESLAVVKKHQVEIKQFFPNEGWFEEDPEEIIASVRECLDKVGVALQSDALARLRGVGVTNQRETTILWDKKTGESLAPAVVWCDGRTGELVERMIANTLSKNKDDLRPRCGLPLHTYFSALKIKWLIENRENVRAAIAEGRCLFGTVDSWIIWNLTGGVRGGVHVTDVTNASRTMLMNINTLQWDPELCKFFGIPMEILPEIRSSSEVYGRIAEGPLKDVPICGCLGDQQSALVGQRCFSAGDAKNTYGTGCFLLYNTGNRPVMSHHGMLTTVAYQLGPGQPAMYALEGAVSIAGQSVRWLRDNLDFFQDVSEIEGLAGEVDSTGDVYFVPAFSGLYAPYWQPDARGLMIGLTNYTTKAHLCRATLEAVCFQSREVLDAMNQDSETPLGMLRVDGGMTANTLLLELQADILGIQVVRPKFPEMTALGAALAAGLATGVWQDLSQLPSSPTTTFVPQMTSDERDRRYGRWREAVKRSMHWEGHQEQERGKDKKKRKAALTFALGVITGSVVSAALLIALRRG